MASKFEKVEKEHSELAKRSEELQEERDTLAEQLAAEIEVRL